MQKEKFSLKDHLFNGEKVNVLADSIREVYDDFEIMEFIHEVLLRFPELELKERIVHIKKCLVRYLPKDFEEAVDIILRSLPPELDPEKTDDDFGDFIYAPYGEFIADKGLEKYHLELSFRALSELTKRFSMENAVRYFLNEFEGETFEQMKRWSKSENYHHRRLASEGTRPSLPWCQNIALDYKKPTAILDNLYNDHTRYVTRSVANHMNDISKKNASLVLDILKGWKQSGKQEAKEMDFIISHSLRTLVKDGNNEALGMLGYGKPDIKVKEFEIFTPLVHMGEYLEFEFYVVSNKEQNLLIDYLIHFVKANGNLSSKTFKISKKKFKKGEVLKVKKKQLFREMTTRKFYSWEHFVELQINGESFGKRGFELVL
jgi:3-methyladenine DNA glycosylase AlkC